MGPTPSAPFAADEGGGEGELEEGGRDLEREQDAGEGVCCVRWAWAGWNDDGGGLAVEEGGGLRGRRRRRVVAHRTVYRWKGRIERVLLISLV